MNHKNKTITFHKEEENSGNGQSSHSITQSGNTWFKLFSQEGFIRTPQQFDNTTGYLNIIFRRSDLLLEYNWFTMFC